MLLVVVFFKQTTAYELRISDWSSDVCSSDLGAAYTKGDVAEYYRSVARWLLPELAGRPLSLLRCPDGSQGECFFQKHHADSLGDDVHAIGLKQKSGRVQYLYVDDIEGVIDLVQKNTLE